MPKLLVRNMEFAESLGMRLVQVFMLTCRFDRDDTFSVLKIKVGLQVKVKIKVNLQAGRTIQLSLKLCSEPTHATLRHPVHSTLHVLLLVIITQFLCCSGVFNAIPQYTLSVKCTCLTGDTMCLAGGHKIFLP